MNNPKPAPVRTLRTARGSISASLFAAGLVILGACSSGPAASGSSAGSGTAAADPSAPDASVPGEATVTMPDEGAPAAFYDTSVVHSVEVEFDQGDYDAMVAAFVETGDKGWLEAEVTIDGVVYDQVGMRLKGNSSLAGLGGDGMGLPGRDRRPTTSDATVTTSELTATAGTSGTGPTTDSSPDIDSARVPPADGDRGMGGIGSASADAPEGLPWLIRLDKYIDDQAHQGLTEFVVRSSSTETALNEAVSVGLLAAAGLVTQRAAAAEFTVNDRPARLRLVLENPNEDWMTANLGAGKLYKADASGDYSYRGDDPADYPEAWEQEGGDEDLTPLIDFLEFVNNSDDSTFAAELDQHLDVPAFAEYMAIEDLLQNFDDISGPGNNSYLYYDPQTGLMTVVAWDHNLALSRFGTGPGPGQGGFDPSQDPGGSLPEGFDPSRGPAGGMDGMNRGNVLAERFMANEEFRALYEAALERLRSELYSSGTAQAILDDWSALLQSAATHLVDSETIAAEAGAISEYFVAE